jgi:serine protease inhibitor
MKKTIIRSSVICIFLVSSQLISCKKESSAPLPTDPVPITLTTDQVSMISSENTFALDLFKKVVDNSGAAGNLILSPLSISSALSMTVNGANGSTRDAMLTALRQNGLTPDMINNAYKDLTEALLKVDQRVLISIANSVWTENNFVVKNPFKDILTSYYNADAKSFDVTDPQVPGLVNTWIESKTNGLIKNMIDQLDPQTIMLLINAIYFKGKWTYQFDKANTVNGVFHKPDGTTANVSMMTQKTDLKVYKGEGFSMAEFPYGQGNFVMDVILPDDKGGTYSSFPVISDTSLKGWLAGMSKTETEVTFPRFKYGFKKELKEVLSDMGMSVAFSDMADFSNISDLSTKLSFVLHQAFIETNEEGTEAAAATIVGIINTSVIIPFTFKMDHPFLYLIRETSTNSILFIGRVTDPSAG